MKQMPSLPKYGGESSPLHEAKRPAMPHPCTKSGEVYVRHQGETFGPYQERTLHTLFSNGYFNPDDEALLQHDSRWIPLSSLWPAPAGQFIPEEFSSELDVNPPLPASSYSAGARMAVCMLAVMLAVSSGGALLMLGWRFLVN